MKGLFYRVLKVFLTTFLGKGKVDLMIVRLAQLVESDLLILAYHNIGIMKYEDDHVSGEHHFIASCLGKHLKSANPVFFDVGANVGDYATKLRRQFPTASIYAFEPNNNTYEVMLSALAPLNIHCFNLGMSSKSTAKMMYTYENEMTSQHASIYKDVLVDLHGADRVKEIMFNTTTIDEFCEANGIDHIDLLKIDTEGHEWEVLIGAKRMVEEDRIHLIQFEFNEMNIIARVFLKDFYQFLRGYRIYRLDSNGLIPLFEYNSSNEIFKFQNLLAVSEKFGSTGLI